MRGMRRPTGRVKDDSGAESLPGDRHGFGLRDMEPGVTPGVVGARDIGSLQSRHCREVPLHQSEWTEYSRATLSCQS